MTATEDNIHPWRIYGKEFEVPESKMGKSDTDKGYPLPTSAGEGSRVLSGGATVHMEKPKEKKKENKMAIDLSSVPTTKKATVAPDMDKERSMTKSIAALETMASLVAPAPIDQGTDLLKACKACMDKGAESSKKADIGTMVIPEREGAKPSLTGEGALRAGPYGSGPAKPGSEKIAEKQQLGKGVPQPQPVPMGKAVCQKCDSKDCSCKDFKSKEEDGGEDTEKAITSMSVPRLPKAMQQEMIRRNAQSVLTRGNSRFAKDIHTGPLTGEVVAEVDEAADRRTGRLEVFKACGGCGRRYKMFKGVDSGCPTCQINKSTHCGTCTTQLVKSHGGMARCPLCG